MGLETSASLNEWVNAREPNLSLTGVEPKEGIIVPLAATKGDDEEPRRSTGEAGKTDTSAPVSTKKVVPETSSRTKSDPWEGLLIEEMVPGVIDPRRARFPKMREAELS